MAIKFNSSRYILNATPPDFITDINYYSTTDPDAEPEELTAYRIVDPVIGDERTVWLKPYALTTVNKNSVIVIPPIANALALAATNSTGSGIINTLDNDTSESDLDTGLILTKPTLDLSAGSGQIQMDDYQNWLKDFTETQNYRIHLYNGKQAATSFSINDAVIYSTKPGSCNAIDMGSVNPNEHRCQWTNFPHRPFTQRNYSLKGIESFPLSPQYACDGDVLGPAVNRTPAALGEEIPWHIANTAPRFEFKNTQWVREALGLVTQWPSMPLVFLYTQWMYNPNTGVLSLKLTITNYRYHNIGIAWGYIAEDGMGGTRVVDYNGGTITKCNGWGATTTVGELSFGQQTGPGRTRSLNLAYIMLYTYDNKTQKRTWACTLWTQNGILPSNYFRNNLGCFQNYRGLSDTSDANATIALTVSAPAALGDNVWKAGTTIYLGNNSDAANTGQDS